MHIETRKDGSVRIISLIGRLDTLSAGEAEKGINALIDQGDNSLLIDMKEISYISSSGLRVLLTSAKRLKNQNGKIILATLNDNVKEVFDIAGFTLIFTICQTTEEALGQFS